MHTDMLKICFHLDIIFGFLSLVKMQHEDFAHGPDWLKKIIKLGIEAECKNTWLLYHV